MNTKFDLWEIPSPDLSSNPIECNTPTKSYLFQNPLITGEFLRKSFKRRDKGILLSVIAVDSWVSNAGFSVRASETSRWRGSAVRNAVQAVAVAVALIVEMLSAVLILVFILAVDFLHCAGKDISMNEGNSNKTEKVCKTTNKIKSMVLYLRRIQRLMWTFSISMCQTRFPRFPYIHSSSAARVIIAGYGKTWNINNKKDNKLLNKVLILQRRTSNVKTDRREFGVNSCREKARSIDKWKQAVFMQQGA